MDSRQSRIEDQNVATQSLLSSLADTDFTKAITEFQTLQTALQATMQTSADAEPLADGLHRISARCGTGLK